MTKKYLIANRKKLKNYNFPMKILKPQMHNNMVHRFSISEENLRPVNNKFR